MIAETSPWRPDPKSWIIFFVEGFWENILEVLAIAAKIFVVALVVRTALHYMDIKVYFPIVDPIIDMAMALLSGRAN